MFVGETRKTMRAIHDPIGLNMSITRTFGLRTKDDGICEIVCAINELVVFGTVTSELPSFSTFLELFLEEI